jgi:regulatory protein
VGHRRSSEPPSAWEDALRQLARAPLSEAGLRRRLCARGHAAPDVDAACERLRALGYLDDRRFAREFIDSRMARRAVGPRRLAAELEARGVSHALAEEALEAAEASGDLVPGDALRQSAARLVRGARALDRRSYARVYNALLRAGFDEDAIRGALAPLRDPASDDEPTTDEASHDFP